MKNYYLVIIDCPGDDVYRHSIAGIINVDYHDKLRFREALRLLIKEHVCADQVLIPDEITINQVGKMRRPGCGGVWYDEDGETNDYDLEITETATYGYDPETWHETHYEVVAQIEWLREKNFMDEREGEPIHLTGIAEIQYKLGLGGLYTLAEELTNEFEAMHWGIDWGESPEFEDWRDTLYEYVRKHPKVTGQ